MSAAMDRFAVLDAARAAVTQRQEAYGTPEDNARIIAAYWSVLFGVEVSPHKVALALDLVKTARLHHDPGHADSWVDKAGYSAYGGEVALLRANARTVSLLMRTVERVSRLFRR